MKYWQRRKQAKLYKQWAEHAELTPEFTPPLEGPADMKPGMDMETPVTERKRFYRFRVRILDTVRKILRVE